MVTLVMPLPMKAFLAVIVAIITYANIVVANAQQLPNPPATAQDNVSKFQSTAHGFSVSVPQGWVIQDLSDEDTTSLLTEMLHGYRMLAELCPQEQAFHGIGGTYNCSEAHDVIHINRYPKLAQESEFASIFKSNNSSIAANEYFLEHQIRNLQELGYGDVRVINNTGMLINVRDIHTNKTVAEVPANLLEMTYTKNSTETRGYFLLAATNAISDMEIISGYGILYEADAGKMPSGIPPQSVNRVFQSFEFIKGEQGGHVAKVPSGTDGSYANSTTTISEPPPIALPSSVFQYQANNTASPSTKLNGS